MTNGDANGASRSAVTDAIAACLDPCRDEYGIVVDHAMIAAGETTVPAVVDLTHDHSLTALESLYQ